MGYGEGMELQEVKRRIEEIKKSSPYCEEMHGLEDDLMKEFIRYVATGEIILPDTVEIAQEIKTVFDMSFPRHCS